MQVAAWYRGTPGHEIQKQVSIDQTPNHAKFRRPLTRSVRDIFAPGKVDKSSPK